MAKYAGCRARATIANTVLLAHHCTLSLHAEPQDVTTSLLGGTALKAFCVGLPSAEFTGEFVWDSTVNPFTQAPTLVVGSTGLFTFYPAKTDPTKVSFTALIVAVEVTAATREVVKYTVTGVSTFTAGSLGALISFT